ncbi:hypothetical protein [Maledivibacter halophilus]|uniref:Uncharacterized protein n=1 Tax=Maledivibacter halophilus TaxID=36842 RepID=A0A1T5M3T6_9FIRM|nr:hypothetical protein [Maledivibacter halophilus]SKC82890.1 hypothetical protein SAMN02194393_03771 [Maledivibacter halophilus]
MADYTDNYNLKKPNIKEKYSVNDQNENMDILDGELRRIDVGIGELEKEVNTGLAELTANYNFNVTCTDTEGRPIQTQYTKQDASLYLQVDASNPDANGFYQRIEEKYYEDDGTTLLKTVIWTLTYNEDGLVTTRNWVVS